VNNEFRLSEFASSVKKGSNEHPHGDADAVRFDFELRKLDRHIVHGPHIIPDAVTAEKGRFKALRLAVSALFGQGDLPFSHHKVSVATWFANRPLAGARA